MKTTKFMAMLLAAFALAFSFASCGSDDDEPTPNPNPPAEGTTNVLKIGNQSTTINAASWEILDFNNDGELRYQCIKLRGSNDAFIRIGFWAVTTSGVIPTGTYRLDERGDAAVYGGGRIGETGFNFALNEAGNGSLIIKQEGDEFTVTIDPLMVNIQEPEQTVKTKLEYKGKIEIVTHHEEESDEWVDLGLPSGVKWSTRNLGAETESDCGYYYAWGELDPKQRYVENNSSWIRYSYSGLQEEGVIDENGNLTPQHDAARATLGDTWRIPTYAEIQELGKNCTWEWTVRNGRSGHVVTGPNGKTIFMPASGYYNVEEIMDNDIYGYYWSATAKDDETRGYAYTIQFEEYSFNSLAIGKFHFGFSIRPVKD